jgi:hypothetical protein
VIEISSYESDPLPQSITTATSTRQLHIYNFNRPLAFAATRLASVTRGYSALVRRLQSVDRFNNRIPWRLVCHLANQLGDQQANNRYEEGN